MDVLVAYCEPWDTPLRTSKHHFISRLAARGHRVLYVENPYTPLSVLRRPREFLSSGVRRVRAGARPVGENVWAMTCVAPLPYHAGLWGIFDNPKLNAANQRLVIRRIQLALTAIGLRNLIVLNYYPFLLPVLDELDVSRVVFHMVDEWQGMPRIPRSMATLTRAMLERADISIVTSRRLLDRYAGLARDIRLLRHGTDLSLFGPVSRGEIEPSPALTRLSGVKIGYYGALHKLDYSLIAMVARRRPDWTFIFVGPLGGVQGVNVPSVTPSNVLFWNSWNRESLPAFLAGVDVFWMPFVRSELTHSMCPIKLFEVLSSGRPLVSTDLEETRDVAGTLVEYAVTEEGHIDALERAVDYDDAEHRQKRVAAMSQYDWMSRMEEFEKLLTSSKNEL